MNKYGINEDILSRHKKNDWTFRRFIVEIEGFNSLKQYDTWLSEMNEEDRNSTRWYYTQKYLCVLQLAEREEKAAC